ncbi:hypothetical protein [Halobacillus sp. H74]|uniref:hypothetical protein n=1 Tax=Halobacillus sp. H74 TaxID=3457436 RepID=UPI003FCE23B0
MSQKVEMNDLDLELELDLGDLEVSDVEVLDTDEAIGMAEGQASFAPSLISCTTSIISTSTSSG